MESLITVSNRVGGSGLMWAAPMEVRAPTLKRGDAAPLR
jgi:hypothetical protein